MFGALFDGLGLRKLLMKLEQNRLGVLLGI